jgi:hypothetical protein
MQAPFYAPTYVTIQDPETRQLFEKALTEKEKFIKRVQSDPKRKTVHLPHILRSLALFYGVYSALGMPSAKLAGIEELI